MFFNRLENRAFKVLRIKVIDMGGRKYFRIWRHVLYGLSSVLRNVPPLADYFLNFIPGSGKLALATRYVSLRAVAKRCGDNVYIDSSVRIKNGQYLSIGRNVSIHSFCYIDSLGGIDIGKNVSIAHSVSILSADHTWEDLSRPIKYNPVILRPTVIEDDVWIGCGVRILGGARIGRRCIVAAGAVVKGELAPGGLYAGVPARRIRDLPLMDGIEA